MAAVDGNGKATLAAMRSAGARFVIAVDVSAAAGSTPPEAPASMPLRDERRRARIEPEVAQADFLIHPALAYWAGPRRSYFEASRTLGEATARAALPALLQQLRDRA